MDELTDPESLRDRDDVEYVENPPEVHQHHHDAYDDIAGYVVVGVTDPEGRLLVLEHDDAPYPHLCFTEVDHDEEYVEAARGIVTTATGVDATGDDVLRVRRSTYRAEDGRETSGYDVVFTASPVETTEIDPEAGHDWTASWRDPTTIDLPAGEDNDVVNDVRLFL
ncbi:hypothetical protein GQS65_07170 [Halomarina oriensis]|uniref:NUDIX domain-containing protein n=2 Tax=Halomarina oriensis TaxID=671145 RepID=A0A6B0GK64_9EURY|nr:hypothetical protein [Halomarina oriensis]MWG34271.1 hypothetical protein [Halomarina oriensis]